jgi:putative copper export protein
MIEHNFVGLRGVKRAGSKLRPRERRELVMSKRALTVLLVIAVVVIVSLTGLLMMRGGMMGGMMDGMGMMCPM